MPSPFLPSPLLAQRVALALLAFALGVAQSDCRRYRSLEEIEQALEPLQGDAPVAEPDDPLEAGLLRLRRLFAPHGEPLLEQEVDVAPSADLTLTLDAGSCYSAAAFTDARVDLDLELTEPTGLVVAFDRSPDPFPVVSSFCASTSGTYALRLRTVRGQARARVGAWRLPESAELVALRELSAVRDARYPGARASGPAQRAFIAERRAHEVPVAMIPGRCYGAAALGDPGVVDVDLAWLDATGAALLQDIAVDAEPVLAPICPTEALATRLRLSMREGEGAVHWQVYEWEG